MRLHPEPKPVTATDDEIRAAVAEVQPVPLLAAVAALTGDLTVLRDDLRPDVGSFDPDAGLGPDQLADAREVAAAALARYRDAGSIPAPSPGASDLRRILEFLAGGPVADDYVAVMTEELALGDADLRAPDLAGRGDRPRSGVPRRRHRRGDVGDRGRPPARPGRRRLRDPGEERRRRWHVAREPLPRVSRRRAEPLLQLLVRADAGVAAVLRDAVEPPRLLPDLRDRARDPRARAIRDRGGRRDLGRGAHALVHHGAHPRR